MYQVLFQKVTMLLERPAEGIIIQQGFVCYTQLFVTMSNYMQIAFRGEGFFVTNSYAKINYVQHLVPISLSLRAYNK